MSDATVTPTATARPDPFAVLTAAALALLALSLVWSLSETRLVGADPAWLKPAKFAVSFVVHFGTLSLVAARLSPQARRGWWITGTGAVMAAAFLAEMAYLFFQAAQGEASHFNTATVFHQTMYALMGLGAVLLILGPVLVAWAARRDSDARLGPATVQGLWLGAWASFGLTLVVAGYMSSGSGHLVGTPSLEAAALPLVGWSAEVGDLRPAHFLSLHALQGLPLLGLWLDRTGRGARRLPWAALAWTALTLAVFGQALLGLPLIRL